MTRSPSKALSIVVPAPIEQSRPMRTPVPITAFAPITLPLPISTPGPTTAPGSTVTPSSIRARASTWASEKSAGLHSEAGRNACGNNLRAAVTKARYGSRTVSTATRDGNSLARTSVVRQAPACVAAAAGDRFLFSKKARSQGAARSSGPILTMRRECGAGCTSVAPVTAASSSSVRPDECRRKTGSFILKEPGPPTHQPPPRSESSAAAETENLRAVAHLYAAGRSRAVFCDGIGQVETQWSERRIPKQTDADRRSDHRWTVEPNKKCFAGYVPTGWPLVIP